MKQGPRKVVTIRCSKRVRLAIRVKKTGKEEIEGQSKGVLQM